MTTSESSTPCSKSRLMPILLPLPPADPPTDRPTITLLTPPIKKRARIQLPPATRTHGSPKKRVRVISQGFSRKRHHSDVQIAAESTLPEAQSSRTILTDVPSFNPNENPLSGDTNSVDHDPALFDKEFQFYLRAVFGKSVGLYQICETLWVVQGWTQRSGGNSVCLEPEPYS